MKRIFSLLMILVISTGVLLAASPVEPIKPVSKVPAVSTEHTQFIQALSHSKVDINTFTKDFTTKNVPLFSGHVTGGCGSTADQEAWVYWMILFGPIPQNVTLTIRFNYLQDDFVNDTFETCADISW